MKSNLVVTAEQVAGMLNCTAATFRGKRPILERDHNFPRKLPTCNGWSRAAVTRWIETNGETYLPANPSDEALLAAQAEQLEQDYR